jgi:hypothetical protein
LSFRQGQLAIPNENAKSGWIANTRLKQFLLNRAVSLANVPGKVDQAILSLLLDAAGLREQSDDAKSLLSGLGLLNNDRINPVVLDLILFEDMYRYTRGWDNVPEKSIDKCFGMTI